MPEDTKDYLDFVPHPDEPDITGKPHRVEAVGLLMHSRESLRRRALAGRDF